MSKFLYGVQTSFNGWVPPDILRGLAERRFTLARIDAQTVGPAVLGGLIQQAVDADLEPFVIVSSLEQIQLLPAGTRCEWKNEPDLALGRPTPIPPAQYAVELAVAALVARDQGCILYGPVISNLNTRGLQYLKDIGPLPEGVRCSFHRYGNNTFNYAHPPARTREDEVIALKTLIGDTPFLVSELGYHLAKTGWWIFARSLSESAQAEYMTQEWAFWQQAGAEGVVWYQLFDGAADRPLERYGLYDPTAKRWKPVADTVPTTEPPMPPETKHAAFAVVVTNEQDGAPVNDATVLVSTGGMHGTTNADGYVVFIVEQKSLTFSVHKTGFADYASPVIEIHGDTQVGAKVTSTAPVVQPLSRLVRIDKKLHRMINEKGEPIYGRGASFFLAYKRYLDGHDLTPQLEQLRGLGCNLVRLMGMFESLGGFNPKQYPDYYTKIPAFMTLLESFGIYGLWTACAATGGMFTEDEAVTHIKKTAVELLKTHNAIFSPVNEQEQHNNSINRQRFVQEVPMDWMIYDTGSFGGDLPCKPPFGKYAPFHVRRDYPSSVKDCGIIDHTNRINDGLEIAIDEPYRMGDEGSGDRHTEPVIAREAAGIAYNALYFVAHSMAGERADVLTGNTLDCVSAAMFAMKGH